MHGLRTKLLTFLTFFMLLAVFLPHNAHADPSWTNADCQAMNQSLQDAQNFRAQRKTQNTIDMFSLIAPVSVGLLACLDRLDTILNTLQAFSSLGLAGILNAIIDNLIMQVLNQVCNVVAGTLDQAVNLVNSQVNRFCIPMPNLNLNLRAPHLPSGPTCNGTPLITSVPLNSAPTGPAKLLDLKGWLNYIETNGMRPRSAPTPAPASP